MVPTKYCGPLFTGIKEGVYVSSQVHLGWSHRTIINIQLYCTPIAWALGLAAASAKAGSPVTGVGVWYHETNEVARST